MPMSSLVRAARARPSSGICSPLTKAIDWLRSHTGDLATYNLVVLDPPYRDGAALTATLEALDRAPLRDQALMVVEHYRTQKVPSLERLKEVRERDYGSTRLTFLRYQ